MNNEEVIKEIKKDFYSLRNGIVAESLRKLYEPGKVIFGLTVPQFTGMAKKYPKDHDLGMKLWNDNSSRESRLFSLYLLPTSEIKKHEAIEMIKAVDSLEIAEFLAFKILRHLSYSKELYEEMASALISGQWPNHAIQMLKKNLDQI